MQQQKAMLLSAEESGSGESEEEDDEAAHAAGRGLRVHLLALGGVVLICGALVLLARPLFFASADHEAAKADRGGHAAAPGASHEVAKAGTGVAAERDPEVVTEPDSKVVAAGAAIDIFEFLGEGFCVDHSGAKPQVTANIGFDWTDAHLSGDCEASCRANSSCSAFVSEQIGVCHLILQEGFSAEAADGTPDSRCYWRRTFRRNTTGAYIRRQAAVPKIIWTYWPTPLDSNSTPPGLVEISVASWRSLNPDYSVHVLDEESVWTLLKRKEVFSSFGNFASISDDLELTSSLIQLAILKKYGGVWIDPQTVLLQPLSGILGTDSSIRTFFQAGAAEAGAATAQQPHQDLRAHQKNQVELFFLAAPPQDLLVSRLQECASSALADRELDEALDLQTTLAAACFVQVLDEDAALDAWFNSDRVRVLDALPFAPSWLKPSPEAFRRAAFEEVDYKLLSELLSPTASVLNLPRALGPTAVSNFTREELWCRDGTWHQLLVAKGLHNLDLCTAATE